ncbi:MAG: VOC family protein [Gemmatimonadetes bacterium]|nr:VOC family protein [Gemmatimonadota bacterium]MCH7717070.1 VOC family protein [Gemmatimonadota bacterium]
MSVANETKLTSVMPTMTVNDIRASIAWYRDVMGFSVAREMEHEGQLVGAVVAAGAVQFLLGQDDFAKGKDRAKGVASRLYCIYDGDIDEFAEAIKSRGGTLEQEPTDQPWGARDFAVKDPDGFMIAMSNGAGMDG